MAIDRGGPVIPVYLGPDDDADWTPGGARRWWMHHAAASLDRSLRERGSRLILRRGGDEASTLLELARSQGAGAVVWSQRFEPAERDLSERVESTLREAGVEAIEAPGNLLFEPGEILTGEGAPYKVFTPFWRACEKAGLPSEPLPAPDAIPAPKHWPASTPLDQLGLLPKVDWASRIAETWEPGEAGARRRLAWFVDGPVFEYGEQRNRPDVDATSRLSPHLHHGEVSPRQVVAAVRERMSSGGDVKSAQAFIREVGWREFSYHLLAYFPATVDTPLRPEFRDFPWSHRQDCFKVWTKGQTGYPIVDAGMRQLWRIGWLHNRVRMVVASFLVKHLLVPWESGSKWFWDTLVDADLANNTQGWQWTAGCGADAAPYFRIFNPVSQGERFDPNGDYVRTYVPELERMPAKWIHKPWEAPDDVLEEAGVELGETYPEPMVDHKQARDRALEAFERIKKS